MSGTRRDVRGRRKLGARRWLGEILANHDGKKDGKTGLSATTIQHVHAWLHEACRNTVAMTSGREAKA